MKHLIFTFAPIDLHRNRMIVEQPDDRGIGSVEAVQASGLYKYPHEIGVLIGVLALLQRTSFLLEGQREERE